MRIAIFSDNFYPELSGIADSIIILAKELSRRGHKVNFYAPKYSVKDFKKVGLSRNEIDIGKNIKIERFYSLPFPTATAQGRLVLPTGLRWLKVNKFKPDIIHSQLFFGVGLEALSASKILKIPIIGTNHTAITEFRHYSPIKNQWFDKLSLNFAVWYYNQCDFVTAPSQAVFEEMANHGFKRPHRVISNPIDLANFKVEPKLERESVRRKYHLSEQVIIYAGRLAKEKNLEVMIKALALVKKKEAKINPAPLGRSILKRCGINLVLAGHGKNENQLKQLAKRLKVENNVKFLGTVSKPILAKLYQAAKIFIITSTSETQSLTLMQGFACALPAIGVRARALPEYINKQNGFLVEPGDAKNLAEKINLLLTNESLRQKLKRGALTFAQNFSAENIAEKWEKLYAKVISDFKI
jgi:glycosyltransferase involved in cell wall biosynthesis